MKTTNIITVNPINLSETIFKDERLAKATQRISAIYNDAAKYAEAKNRDIAKILGDVADKKLYEKDGFKSVADYASKVFGIASNNAYALARAGKIYNDKNSHPELQAMPPSKLAELNAVDEKAVIAALNAGTINHESTQKDLREFAESAKAENASTNPVVLNTYNARPCIPHYDVEKCVGPRTMDEWDDHFMNFVRENSEDLPVEVIDIKKTTIYDGDTKKIATRRLYCTRVYSLVVEFYKWTRPRKTKSTKKNKPKYTREELQKMMDELDQTVDGEPING